MNNTTKGYVEIISVAIIWGVTYASLKYGLYTLTYAELAFLRFFIAFFLFIPLIVARYQKITKKELLITIILGFTGVFLYQILFLYGETHIPAGEASFIVSFEPIFIVVLAAKFRHERIGRYFIFGLILSIIGMIFLIGPQNLSFNYSKYVFFILGAALAWAIYTVLGKDILTTHDPLFIVAVSSVFGTIMLFPMTGISAIHAMLQFSFYDYVNIFFLGIVATFAGYVLWYNGLKHLDSSRAGVILYISPFVTVLSAVFIVSEMINIIELVGGFLIILGIFFTTIQHSKFIKSRV